MAKRKQSSPVISFTTLFILFFAVGFIGLLAVSSFKIVQQVKNRLTARQLNTTIISDYSGKYKPQDTTAVFLNKKLSYVPPEMPYIPPYVLGDTAAEKWVEVDLSDQTLYAWEGTNLFLTTLVSTGKWGRTPTGEFRVWTKLRYTTMSGGDASIGTYYYLPNVPYVQFYAGDGVPAGMGYSIHGTYWHNNFGQVMSHGCINLPTNMAEKIFYWSPPELPEGKTAVSPTAANPGLRIVVHE